MLSHILPPRIDNTYRGHPLAFWLLIPIVILKTGIAFGTPSMAVRLPNRPMAFPWTASAPTGRRPW